MSIISRMSTRFLPGLSATCVRTPSLTPRMLDRVHLFNPKRCFCTPSLNKRLAIWKLERRGCIKTWDEFTKFLKENNLSLQYPEKIIVRMNGKMIFERFPGFVLHTGRSVELFIKAPPSPLQLAIKRKDIQKIKELIAMGTNVNGLEVNGEPALFQAVRGGSLRVIRLLVDQGANPGLYEENSSHYDITAFHLAVQEHFYDIVHFFIEELGVPADQHVRFYDYGWPPEPIDFAIPSSEGKLSPYRLAQAEKIALFLLNKNGKKFIRNVDTLFDNAQKLGMKDVAELLVRLGHVKMK